MKQPVVYIMANRFRGTIYTGVTSNLLARDYQHKTSAMDGFTKKYNIKNLVYFEQTTDIESAITREKCIKKWNRDWKIKLIEESNPEWKDLSQELQ